MEQDVVRTGVLLFVLSVSQIVNHRVPNLGHFITIDELVVRRPRLLWAMSPLGGPERFKKDG